MRFTLKKIFCNSNKKKRKKEKRKKKKEKGGARGKDPSPRVDLSAAATRISALMAETEANWTRS